MTIRTQTSDRRESLEALETRVRGIVAALESAIAHSTIAGQTRTRHRLPTCGEGFEIEIEEDLAWGLRGSMVLGVRFEAYGSGIRWGVEATANWGAVGSVEPGDAIAIASQHMRHATLIATGATMLAELIRVIDRHEDRWSRHGVDFNMGRQDVVELFRVMVGS